MILFLYFLLFICVNDLFAMERRVSWADRGASNSSSASISTNNDEDSEKDSILRAVPSQEDYLRHQKNNNDKDFLRKMKKLTQLIEAQCSNNSISNSS